VADTKTPASPVVETAPKTEKALTPAAPPARRSAVRDIEHKPVPQTSRAVKDELAAKLDDKKFDSAMKDAGAADGPAAGESRSLKGRHRVARTNRAPGTKIVGEPAAAPSEVNPTAGAVEELPKTGTTPSAEKTSDKPAVPDEMRRSLKNYGHTDEEIDEQHKADPEGFSRFAKFVHATRQKEIEAYSRLGQQQLPPAVAQQVRAPAPAATNPDELTEAEISAFEKMYPNDVGAKFMVRQARSELAFRNQQRQASYAATEASTQTAVDGFFNQDSMKGYAEHYGDKAKKDKVIETAAAIITGGRLQGRNFNLNDALTMAHDALASPVMKAAARKEIVDEVAQRSAALTQRNQAGAPDATSTPASKKGKKALSRQEIEDRAGERLRKVRI
jgi:hypothetical protein